MSRKRVISFFIFTNIREKLFAVCQRRGQYDFFKERKKSWSGLLQPTCHGKLNKGVNHLDGLYDQVDEELGQYIFMPVSDKLTLLASADGHKVYAAIIDSFTVANLRLEALTGGFQLISFEDINFIRCSIHVDRKGVPPGELVMFSEHLEALKAGFHHFTQ